MIATFLASLIPVPYIYSGAFHDGLSVSQPNLCRRCDSKDCLALINSAVNDGVCSNSFSLFKISFFAEPVVLNGLITEKSRSQFVGQRWKQYKRYYFSVDDINSLTKTLSQVQYLTEGHGQERARDSVAFLHDVRTSLGIVLSWVEKLIDSSAGSSFEDKLARADRITGNLFQSVSLLKEQLDLADIIANPNTITYGQQHRSEAHGFIFKMVKLFEPRGEKRGNRIRIEGNTYAEVRAYNSFQFIPLILLDNAIKYSLKGRDIIVSINERATEVEVIVKSFGPVVEPEYRESIFDKYVRGSNALTINPHGMGMGLYIARLIADANKTRIWYECSANTGNGDNLFGFTMNKA